MTIKRHATETQLRRPGALALSVALGAAFFTPPTLAANLFDLGGDPGTSTRRGDLLERKSTKLKLGLDTLRTEYQAFEQAVTLGRAAAGTFATRQTEARIVGEQVAVDAVAADDPKALARDLRALGAEILGSAGRVISVRVPLNALSALEGLGTLRFARPAWAVTHTGSVTSQGDPAQYSDLARLDFGVDGAGSTVGVLSDSFDCAGTGGGYVADIISGDLPAGVIVLDDLTRGCIDEGRAMAQIVHDVAPGANLAFHTAFNGEADFAQGILDLAAAGADIIVDDVFYYAEPMFQDGVIAQAVDQVDAMGIPYFSSAGNNAREAYQAPFADSGLTGPVGGVLHDFDPGPGVDTRLELIQLQDTIYMLQWQDPFFSVSGPPGASTDLDLCFYAPAGAPAPFFCSAYVNIGDDPIEGGSISGSGNLEISIEKSIGSDPDPLKVVMFGGIAFADTYDGTSAGTLYGHTNAAGANAVGAAAYFLTPAFFEDPPVLNYYSSAGNTPILFDTEGNPIVDIRQKPQFTAPDGGNNTFFGSDFEPDGWPNFFGTSAAAPHAAAVAALMRERAPGLAPDEVTTLLMDTAIDIVERETLGFGGPRVPIGEGYENDSGAGLIDAQAALDAIPELACDLAASPMTLDFGTVPVGQTATEVVELRNLGNVTCDVTTLNVTGDAFTLDPAAPLPPFSVDAGSSVLIPVNYTPFEPGEDDGTLSVASNDPQDPAIEVTLIGFGDSSSGAEADLAITKADWPDPARVGSTLTYTITVTNLGPGTATGVTMSDNLPSRTSFVSASASQGTCTGTNTVICDLASLNAGATAVVEIVVEPTRQGRLTNTATVEAVEDDPDSSNNSATEITRVRVTRP